MKYILSCVIAVLCCWSGCTSGNKTDTADKPVVFTSIVTHKFFGDRVAGGRLNVYALAGIGADPHSFTPTPAQMTALSRAALFARAGVEYENGVIPKLTGTDKNITVIDLRDGIALEQGGCTGHHNGHDHHHHHGAGDPHVWLAPDLAARQVITLRDAFIKIDPAGKERYTANAAALVGELETLHINLTETLQPVRGADMFVYHPAFTYFAAAYGLRQVAVEADGKEPGARSLARLIEQVRSRGIKTIFVQPQFSDKAARTISAQTGCAVTPVDPLPADFFTSMYRLAVTVRNGITGDAR